MAPDSGLLLRHFSELTNEEAEEIASLEVLSSNADSWAFLLRQVDELLKLRKA